jgi:two-component system sensor histidine kinase KdpD
MKTKTILRDIVFTSVILCIAFVVSLGIVVFFDLHTPIPALFSLAVFLISRYTDIYIYGVAASLIGMLAVNFAFTFPYFKFNFVIVENLVSAIVMLVISMMTSVLTTELKRQEKMRIETEKEKMRANLLRAISHDLRTPLTTIYGSSSVMVENAEELSKEQMKELADDIREDSQWLIGMVENLLSVTKIDSGDVKLIKTSVVLEELIDSVLVRFKKRYPKQEIQMEIPDDFIVIPMDAVLMTQVIVNMLENAVQHAKGMKTLILRVTIVKDEAVFEIIDDGCGIPKERMDRIFTGYFETGDLPADNQKRNMGIGLSVCASVIKAHDGEITVENLKEGGCCFRFVLKMEEEENE